MRDLIRPVRLPFKMYNVIPPSYPPYPSHMQPRPGALGDLHIDHEWPVQITRVKA